MNMSLPGILPPMFGSSVPVLPVGEKLDGITDHDARLIFDLVSNMRPKQEVLDQYGLTINDLAAKAQNHFWAAAYRETEKIWKSELSTGARIRLKAAYLLEDSLVILLRIIQSDHMPVTAKLEAVKQLTAISTVATDPKKVGEGEKHNITINIGGQVTKVTSDDGTRTATITQV